MRMLQAHAAEVQNASLDAPSASYDACQSENMTGTGNYGFESVLFDFNSTELESFFTIDGMDTSLYHETAAELERGNQAYQLENR